MRRTGKLECVFVMGNIYRLMDRESFELHLDLEHILEHGYQDDIDFVKKELKKLYGLARKRHKAA